MHWPDEIREAEFEELDMKVDVRDPEVKMARQLIQQLSGEFHPDEFHDDYRERLQNLAERKIEGQEITVSAETEEEAAPVVDLMEALKASVAEAKKKRSASSEGEAKKGERKASAS
jgi:DNA end-binding protein Ku